jgi:hypothetical protein
MGGRGGQQVGGQAVDQIVTQQPSEGCRVSIPDGELNNPAIQKQEI